MKKITYILLLAFGLVSLHACKESEYDVENLVPEKYHKILYIKDSGVKKILLYESGEDFKFNFSVYKGGSDPNQPAHAKLNLMTQEEVNAIYAITGINYKIIPANTYVLEDKEVDFSSSDTYQLVNIRLKPELIRSVIVAEPGASWILPIRATSEADSVNGTKNHIAIHITDVQKPVALFITNFELKSVDFNKLADFELNIPFGLSVNNQWAIDYKFELDGDYISAYNAAKGTNYQPFPTGICSFADQIALLSTQGQSDLNIKIKASTLPLGNYMLPIRMKNVSKFTLSADKGVYALALNIIAPPLDRTGWTAEASTEEIAKEGTNGFIRNVMDGNLNTYWHSQYDGMYAPLPHDVIIDMKAQHEVYQVGLTPRTNNRYVKSGEILISNDKINWVKVGTLQMPDNTNDAQYFHLTPTKGRYIKLHITQSYNKNNCSALSEVTIHGL